MNDQSSTSYAQPQISEPAVPEPAVPEPAIGEPPIPEPAGDGFRPSEKFGKALDNAETLLKFAADEGIAIAPEILGPIVAARMRYGREAFGKDEMMAFFAALTRLSALLRPVTASSIEACDSDETKAKLRRDRKYAVTLTVIALLLSGVSFVVNAFDTQINTDVASANALAVTLRSAVGNDPIAVNAMDPCVKRMTPDDKQRSLGITEITQIQQFASLSRDVYKRSLKSDFFTGNWEVDPFNVPAAVTAAATARAPAPASVPAKIDAKDLELNPAIVNFQAEVFCKIALYEQVRDFSRNVVLDNTYIYGTISLYLLPVVYALVGAYAFRLRSFADTIRKRTYHFSCADSARMIGAFIVGAVVSLFNLFTQGVSLSPLAVAFLAGYAVELFFAFLDTLVETFSKKGGGGPVGGNPAGHA